MEQYISVKAVQAEPCVRIDGKIVDHVDDESHEYELGYRIVYPDGYVSFCPKAIFEKSYLKVEPNAELPTKAPSVSPTMVHDFVAERDVRTIGFPSKPVTAVTAKLVNGFTITSSSACVSLENYSETIGAECCMEQIEHELWGHLGFLMCCAVNGFKPETPTLGQAAERFVASSRR